MRVSYFKPRRLFDLSPHPFDIGTILGFWHNYDDSHFILKIYKISEGKFADYYGHHLKYSLDNHIASEEDFFRHVWQIVQNRIRHYEMQDPFSSNHAIHKASIEKLQKFQKYLDSIDLWNARPAHVIITEKEQTIQDQKMELERLQARLASLNQYEVAQKIRIEDEHLPTLISLIQQMRELQLSSGRKLLRSDHKSPYPKMISKYFSHGEKDIPIETVRNYFVEKKGDVAAKGTTIKPEHRIFEIVPVKEDRR
jgi:hypothetical protein